MPYLGLFDEHKRELRGRGYRRASTTRDKFFRRMVRWPPATARWPCVYYVAKFTKEQDRVSVDWAPLDPPKLLKKGDTIVVHVFNRPKAKR